MMSVPFYYKGSRVVLLNQHEKEWVIAPLLELDLGCYIELVTKFDNPFVAAVRTLGRIACDPKDGYRGNFVSDEPIFELESTVLNTQ